MPADISIITPTLNAAVTIGHCIDSVQGQVTAAGTAVEHIIIDGCSIDGSQKIIRDAVAEYGTIRWISQPDKGLYDAINKGIQLSSGEIIGVLNADDCYADNTVFDSVVRVFADGDGEIDAVYGDLVYVDRDDVERIVRYWSAGAGGSSRFYNGWMPPHPTFFVRRRCYEAFGMYNQLFGTAADYELMLRFCLSHCIRMSYIPRVLVRMRTGGLSNMTLQGRIAANVMDRRAWDVNGLKPRFWTLWLKPLRKLSQWWLRPPT